MLRHAVAICLRLRLSNRRQIRIHTGRWRWHVLIKAERPQDLGRVARYLVERFEIPKQFGLRLTVDRDPVALL